MALLCHYNFIALMLPNNFICSPSSQCTSYFSQGDCVSFVCLFFFWFVCSAIEITQKVWIKFIKFSFEKVRPSDKNHGRKLVKRQNSLASQRCIAFSQASNRPTWVNNPATDMLKHQHNTTYSFNRHHQVSVYTLYWLQICTVGLLNYSICWHF